MSDREGDMCTRASVLAIVGPLSAQAYIAIGAI